MAVGDRIKRIRNFRGLTQREMGVAIGFQVNTADVRIAQYESGTRTPKEDTLRKIAEALDVNYRSLYEPMEYHAEDIMYTLFELDELYGSLTLYDVEDTSDRFDIQKHKAVSFHVRMLDDFMAEWQQRKTELASGEITREEYLEWKLNWPQSADDLGKFEPTKEWRKENG
jgi:transcriptional regulator with XRE-family HTH domain